MSEIRHLLRFDEDDRSPLYQCLRDREDEEARLWEDYLDEVEDLPANRTPSFQEWKAYR